MFATRRFTFRSHGSFFRPDFPETFRINFPKPETF